MHADTDNACPRCGVLGGGKNHRCNLGVLRARLETLKQERIALKLYLLERAEEPKRGWDDPNADPLQDIADMADRERR